MYLIKVIIKNIRSIRDFQMTFRPPNYAGWHVLIGDNGAGKSTIVRSIALALLGPEEALGLRTRWSHWLKQQEKKGSIRLDILRGPKDKHTGRQGKMKKWLVPNIITFERVEENVKLSTRKTPVVDPDKYNWGTRAGWFSVAYGPYRRFAGGNQEWTKVFYSQPKLGAHLSAFGEDIALTETIDWLVKLNYQLLENKESGKILHDLMNLINSSDFLPHDAKIERVGSDGVFFKDGNGAIIDINQLSDGYRSILSLTLELIHQLVRVYGADDVFSNIRKDEMFIDLPGIVLIDEIDAHLHPTWQTKIGHWFIKYFPKIQFIVTTHSPLVCRASEHGTIWKLSSPGEDGATKEIVGADRQVDFWKCFRCIRYRNVWRVGKSVRKCRRNAKRTC